MDKLFKPDLGKIPHQPGCYLMFDKSGNVIYVGKAIDLRKRAASYWSKADQPIKTSKLLEKVAKLDFMITDTETEALILENQLIKKHLPPYNVLLRDDKSYQYIKIDLNQPYPVIEVVRNLHAIKKEPRVRYFGPYTSGLAVKYTLQLINRIFPLCANVVELNRVNSSSPSSPSPSSGRRGVTPHLDKGEHRTLQGRGGVKPCLNWHLGKCLGVCAGQSTSKEYHQVVHEVIDFLGGKSKDWRKYLRQRMEAAAVAKKFEEALKLREQLAALDIIVAKQKVAQPDELISQDIWGWLITAEQAVVTISKIRAGKVIDYQTFVLRLPMEINLDEFAADALMSVYSATLDNWPKEILLPHLPKDPAVLEGWLSNLAGHTIKISVPQRGIKKRLSLLMQKNAAEQASAKVGANLQIKTAITRLQQLLGVKQLKRMEAYDISHLGGTYTVGSMVVFVNGKPFKSGYRRFRIKTVRGIDDYASLGEMIYRRLQPKRLADLRFAANLPDAILIDGGKGQLNTILRQTNKINIVRLPLIISLAKREEEIFVPTQAQPIKLSLSSPELQLLQRLRDEAHRFAITYQTALRTRQLKEGSKIKGIGTSTSKKLIKAFGSLRAARAASLSELEKVIGQKAKLIKNS
ncbi:TPA: excinuclease ABC subunit C [Patescibacteria group bacterium]|nr:excinuclease ABC subunit C [Patescibacteria group bacterium]